MSAQTEDAPYGHKPDGTPRKRPAPTWMNDPEKVAAAAAKRSGPRSKPAAAHAERYIEAARTQPALTIGEADDMLSRHRREWDERMKELAPLVDEYRRLEQALEVLNTV